MYVTKSATRAITSLSSGCHQPPHLPFLEVKLPYKPALPWSVGLSLFLKWLGSFTSMLQEKRKHTFDQEKKQDSIK